MYKNIIVWIAIFIILLASVFAYMEYREKNRRFINTSQGRQNQLQQNQSEPDIDLSIPKIYSNSQYGFSFDYPSNWMLKEDIIKKEIVISTDDSVSLSENYKYPSWSIKIKVANKDFFSPAIGTKVGMITYDSKLSSIASDGKCMKAKKIFENITGNNTVIKGFAYGSSMMSSPAYADYAILTNSKDIIILHSEQGDVLTPELNKELNIIINSFSFIGDKNIFIPSCAY